MTDFIKILEEQAAKYAEAAREMQNGARCILGFVGDMRRNNFVTDMKMDQDGVIQISVQTNLRHQVSLMEAPRCEDFDNQGGVARVADLTNLPELVTDLDPAEMLYPEKIAQANAENIADPIPEEAAKPAPEPQEFPATPADEAIEDAPAPVAEVAPEPEADPLPPKSKWPVDRSNWGETRKPSAAKKTAPPAPARSDAPGLITGPFTPEDDTYLIERTLAGDPPATIAAALTRKVKQVANRKQRLKSEIEAARKTATEKRRAAKRATEQAPQPKDWAKHLSNLPVDPKWTEQADFDLVNYIALGTGVAGAGAAMRINSEDAHQRYIKLTNGLGVQITFGDREDLCAALKARAEVAA